MTEIVRMRANANESEEHTKLKKKAIRLLKKLGAERIEVEAGVYGWNGPIDVLGRFWGRHTVAIECGNCERKKIDALREVCDVVVHIPYCYTPKIVMPDIWKRVEEEIISRRVCLM